MTEHTKSPEVLQAEHATLSAAAGCSMQYNELSHAGSVTKSDPRPEYLYKVLEDTQSTIRFLDAKATFGIALLAAMFGGAFADLSSYPPWLIQSLSRESLFIAFVVSFLASGVLVARILFPVGNPSKNISGNVPPRLPFYIGDLSPRRWQRFFSARPSFSKLSLSQTEFMSCLGAADDEAIIATLATEVLKVSYIRQIKMERMRAFAWLLSITAALFASLMIVRAMAPPSPAAIPVKLEAPIVILPPAPSAHDPVSLNNGISPSNKAPVKSQPSSTTMRRHQGG